CVSPSRGYCRPCSLRALLLENLFVLCSRKHSSGLIRARQASNPPTLLRQSVPKFPLKAKLRLFLIVISGDSCNDGTELTRLPQMKPIRVLIADDHALVRAGLRALVEKIEGVVVVGEAGKGKEAMQLVRELKPNLMLLDITMPDGGGFDVLDQVTKNFPEIRVIVLTVHEAGEYAIRALREGAAGFLPKSAASTELEQ